MFRSPAKKITVCKSCGAELTLTMGSFIFLQVAFIVTVIPSAILFARIQTWLVRSFGFVHQFSTDSPAIAVVLLWIVPTLVVTLFILSQLARHFVGFEKAD